MPRLFVAIELPDAVTSRAAALKTAIPTARWVRPEHMHITLRFIGEVEDDRVEPIKSALATVKATAFDITLGSVGRFPPSPKKAPRVLWVGIDKNPALVALHNRVEAALARAGIKPERGKDFNPHLTLARLKTHKPTPEADTFLTAQTGFMAGIFTVECFVLIESVLSADGPQYTIQGQYALI
ncbi:MAG: RNA 2',3'-cyclic phosphodiesterase [Chloroflexota bacterium]